MPKTYFKIIYNFGDYITKKLLHAYLILWHYSLEKNPIVLYPTLRKIYKFSKRQKRINFRKVDSLPYKQKHFESRFTKFYESFWLPKRFGFDVRLVQFSSLILTKQMTRDEAIKELSKPPYDEDTISKEIEYVSNKLEISQKELLEYLDIPKKSYKDYKNQSEIYKLGTQIFRLFKLGMAAKR